MGGGDLLNLLIERDIFEEDFTRFYIAEVSELRRSGRYAFTYAIVTLSLLRSNPDPLS